jgi:hypothetical protein
MGGTIFAQGLWLNQRASRTMLPYRAAMPEGIRSEYAAW